MSIVKTYKDENAVDICIRAYENIEGLVPMCLDNGVAVDHEETAAVDRTVNDELAVELKKIRPLFQPVVVPKVAGQMVNSDQNLVDLALQEMGSIEGLVALLRENGIDFANEPAAGVIINVKTADIVNADVRQFYRDRNYKVNTGAALGEAAILNEDGTPLQSEDGTVLRSE